MTAEVTLDPLSLSLTLEQNVSVSVTEGQHERHHGRIGPAGSSWVPGVSGTAGRHRQGPAVPAYVLSQMPAWHCGIAWWAAVPRMPHACGERCGRVAQQHPPRAAAWWYQAKTLACRNGLYQRLGWWGDSRAYQHRSTAPKSSDQKQCCQGEFLHHQYHHLFTAHLHKWFRLLEFCLKVRLQIPVRLSCKVTPFAVGTEINSLLWEQRLWVRAWPLWSPKKPVFKHHSTPFKTKFSYMNKYHYQISSQVATCASLSEAQLGIITVATAARWDVSKQKRPLVFKTLSWLFGLSGYQTVLLLNDSMMSWVHQSRLIWFSIFETCLFLFSTYFRGAKTVAQARDSNQQLVLLLWEKKSFKDFLRFSVWLSECLLRLETPSRKR